MTNQQVNPNAQMAESNLPPMPNQNQPTVPGESGSRKLVVLVIFGVIALAVVAGVYFLIRMNQVQENTIPSDNAIIEEEEEEELVVSTPVSAPTVDEVDYTDAEGDMVVDETIKEIDDALNSIDENADFEDMDTELELGL